MEENASISGIVLFMFIVCIFFALIGYPLYISQTHEHDSFIVVHVTNNTTFIDTSHFFDNGKIDWLNVVDERYMEPKQTTIYRKGRTA